eukprot:1920178-Rhodomonas_salina.6
MGMRVGLSVHPGYDQHPSNGNAAHSPSISTFGALTSGVRLPGVREWVHRRRARGVRSQRPIQPLRALRVPFPLVRDPIAGFDAGLSSTRSNCTCLEDPGNRTPSLAPCAMQGSDRYHADLREVWGRKVESGNRVIPPLKRRYVWLLYILSQSLFGPHRASFTPYRNHIVGHFQISHESRIARVSDEACPCCTAQM